MKTKNLILEIISDRNGKRYFVVREIVLNQAPVTLHVTDDSSDLASFFASVEME